MHGDMILILDFGGPQSQSVARKVRGERVYCEVLPYTAPIDLIRAKAPKGLMLVGAPRDESDGPACTAEIYDLGLPILAIGYPSRKLLSRMGGRLLDTAISEQTARVSFQPCPLFDGLSDCERYIVRMDDVQLWEGAQALALAGETAAAFGDEHRRVYGMQFTAEQNDPDGLAIIANFARGICGCEPWWSMDAFIEDSLSRIRDAMGNGSALMAISGGVDSSVCAALMHRAIGDRMHCLFVNTGLMRKGEPEGVQELFRRMGMEIHMVDAADRFLGCLRGITDPEEKRRIIADEFVRVFEDESDRCGKVNCLVQGTIYPDVIEGYAIGSVAPKTHYYVGAFPVNARYEQVLEPVSALFKDEVRAVGEALDMPAEIIARQPFPGPGLAVRCMGEVTEEKLAILREADAIFREEVAAAGLDKRIGQYFAVLTDAHTTGVCRGERTYDYAVALRAVNSVGAAAATAYRLPYDLLERVADRITNEAPHVNRVVYDVTNKPRATVEWE